MEFRPLEDTKDIGEAFIARFTLPWEELQLEMKKAIEEQNFERAAVIRDEIKKLKEVN